MNTATDLAARSVSFISLVQDTFLQGAMDDEREKETILHQLFSLDFEKKFREYINRQRPDIDAMTNFQRKAIELVWISENVPDPKVAASYATELSIALAAWICLHKKEILAKLDNCGDFPTPYCWREAIAAVLYSHVEERVALANALEYLPVQVVLASNCEKYGVRKQRIAQLWNIEQSDVNSLLSVAEQNTYKEIIGKYRAETVEQLLQDDHELLQIIRKKAPLQFELIFMDELQEIRNNRKKKQQEISLIDKCTDSNVPDEEAKPGDPPKPGKAAAHPSDTYGNADEMELYALAFSGGGIRSATFNLGILQGLAKNGLVTKFDYLSTVSGGGYIGSWLVSWIKRNGSISKVTDRLNPDKSPDPFAEEVRPIRWLRMFSNYFAPVASLMSVDAWTVGITWIRNTLLTQLIILLLFLSVLSLLKLMYLIWAMDTWHTDAVLYVAGIIAVSISVLAGLGMQTYHKGPVSPISIQHERARPLSNLIVLSVFALACLMSAFFFANEYPRMEFSWQPSEQNGLGVFGILLFLGLCIIAFLGRYNKCITAFGLGGFAANLIIVATAALCAIVAVMCFAGAWQVIQFIKLYHFHSDFSPSFFKKLAFSVSVPIVLLVFSITVVFRMAILGKYFPDERREWWGRMGAIVNRSAFIWLMLAASSLLGAKLFDLGFHYYKVSIISGWTALVGGAVKAAFSSSSSGKEKTKSGLSKAVDLFSLAGPYIFILGLLVFLPSLLDYLLRHYLPHFHFTWLPQTFHRPFNMFICFCVLFLPAIFLSWRAGVNEFSMHHFYRNRLVRAYLGATRRKTDREKTANLFTNFDMADDIKLAEFRNDKGYYGPYPILNTALNASHISNLDRQDRKAESFIFSPLYCGFDFSMTRPSANVQTKSYDYAYRPTENYAYPYDSRSGCGGPGIGTAMAISGAAVSPNQGYHSSAATAFLLTVFNLQMGWWIGNPRKSDYKKSDPELGLTFIIFNLIGATNTRRKFVSLSDGGHFDNMGLYEMVRRRCKFIVLGDGEHDDQFTCEGLANAIRRCRIDFGAEIDIDVKEITNRDDKNFSKKQYAIGTIKYAGDSHKGMLLYIKSSVVGDEPVDVREYAMKNETFPHQTTADQFFDEAQFESYRQLGLHIADKAFSDPDVLKGLGLPPLKCKKKIEES